MTHHFAIVLASTAILCGMVPPADAREVISLNGIWHAQYSAQPDNPPGGEWREVEVPAIRSMQIDRPHLWYRRTFTVPQSMQGKHLFLKFVGVKFVSRVWVNGKDVGGHYGGWEPFELDITDKCRTGENGLLVRTTDVTGVIAEKLDPSQLKRGQRFVELAKDSIMAPVGSRTGDVGIWQDVSLVALSDVFVEDVFVKTSVRKKRIDADVTLRNLGGKDRNILLKSTVLDGEAPALTFDDVEVAVPARSAKTVTISKPWESPKLWSHLSPHLYHLVTSVAEDDRELDSLKTRFGFREFWIDGIYFVLNGKRIKFLATAGHPPAESDIETAKKYYRGMRDANCVAVRLHANVWPEWWFDAADEFGMLVVQETAVWCFPKNYALSKPKFWENYRNHLRGMFKRDKNHPSIMFYSLENEILHCGGDYIPDTEQRLADIGLFMKKLDPTRPIMYDADGDPKGVADVVNLHYAHEFPRYNLFPDTCYWVDEKLPAKEFLGGEWKWARKKPLYMGEFMWSPAKTPAPYALFLGDEAYPNFHAGRARGKAIAWRFQVEAFRQEELAGMCPWTLVESRGFPKPDNVMFTEVKRAYQPNAAFIREYDRRFFGGESVRRTVYLYNDTFQPAKLVLSWALTRDGRVVDSGKKEFAASPAQKIDTSISLRMPQVEERTPVRLVVKVENGGRVAFEDTKDYWVFPRRKPRISTRGKIAVFSGRGVVESVLDKAGVAYERLSDLARPIQADLLIIGAGALDKLKTDEKIPSVGGGPKPGRRLSEFTAQGGTVLVLEQGSYPTGIVPAGLTGKGCTIAFKRSFHHPALKRVRPDDFKFWRGDHLVARDTIAKPRSGGFVTLCDAGAEGGLVYVPLIEMENGRGRLLLSQLLIAEKMDSEPMAQIIFEDLVDFALSRGPAPETRTGVVQEKMPLLEALESVGVLCEDVSGKLAGADLSVFGVLFLEADAAEVAENLPRLREFAESGGTILLHGATPPGMKRLENLFPEKLALGRTISLPVVIEKHAPWIDGLSNHDLYWLGKPTGYRHQPVPLSPEILDYVVSAGPPDPAKCRTIEAEAMEPDSPGHRFENDCVFMSRRGFVSAEIEFPETGEYAFTVRAKGTPVDGIYPEVTLMIGDTRATSVLLAGPDWQTYDTTAEVQRGRHRVSLAFTNDAWNPATGEDRNLWLDKLVWGPARKIHAEKILSPSVLVRVPMGKGACLVDQVNWHARAGSLDKASRYLITLLTNLGVSFEPRRSGLVIAPGSMTRGDDSAVNRIAGAVVHLGTNGSVYAEVRFLDSRKYEFEVTARGTEGGGEFPIVRLSIDDKEIADMQIKRSGWVNLKCEAEVPAGVHKVTLEFTNDYYKPPEDRNLDIARLTIR